MEKDNKDDIRKTKINIENEIQEQDSEYQKQVMKKVGTYDDSKKDLEDIIRTFEKDYAEMEAKHKIKYKDME